MTVYVLDVNGLPLMPTERCGYVRKLLKSNKAQVVSGNPFTIQLLYETENNTQDIDLKIDAGYQHIGISACTDNKELFSGELKLLENQSKRLDDRRAYRHTRRNRLRYRKPRFDNRRRPDQWLAPSIQHKLDSHKKVIRKLMCLLPITKIYVETANFDIQALKNPSISGEKYQKGEMYDFRNLREYTFYRDGYTCQICGKNAFRDGAVLRMHHIGYWKNDHSNTPANTLTLCSKCHTSRNHQKGQILYGLQPKQKSFKPETFMSTVRRMLITQLRDEYTIPVVETFGYLTKSKRIDLQLDKTHYNDAYCVGDKQPKHRCEPVFWQEKRKNNRCLAKFYDAKYVDARTGQKATGKELFNGRTTRNKNLNGENLHPYRQQKISKGRVSIRRQRYPYQPHDTVLWRNRTFEVVGTQNCGTYVSIKNNDFKKVVSTKRLQPFKYAKTVYNAA